MTTTKNFGRVYYYYYYYINGKVYFHIAMKCAILVFLASRISKLLAFVEVTSLRYQMGVAPLAQKILSSSEAVQLFPSRCEALQQQRPLVQILWFQVYHHSGVAYVDSL